MQIPCMSGWEKIHDGQEVERRGTTWLDGARPPPLLARAAARLDVAVHDAHVVVDEGKSLEELSHVGLRGKR